MYHNCVNWLIKYQSTFNSKKYGELGHNKRSCKGNKATDRAMPKEVTRQKRQRQLRVEKERKRPIKTNMKFHKDLKHLKLLTILDII